MEILRQLRKERKLTQAKLAKALGVSRSTVSMWEINASEPDRNMVLKIAEYFHVSTDYLLGRDGQNEKPAAPEDDGLYAEIYGIVSRLSPENRAKLLELARLYLDAQNKTGGNR